MLVPAAREDTIDAAVAGQHHRPTDRRGSQSPDQPRGQEILHERGVVVVPDFIANAGGIVAAAHSTDARYSPFTVDPAGVFTMISEKLRANTVRVLTDSRTRGITPRQAAMELAQGRVLAAMTARGFRPAAPDTDWRQVPAA